MKLFTADIDKKLFAQYLKGSDLANQVVVAKIFNPYGRGTWYLLNSDPEDPEYLWAIVDMDDIEVGSVNRSDLENIRIKPFMLGLERDLSFRPVNALELYKGVNQGKHYAKGGGVTNEIAEIKAKIEKAKKNTIMPANLKKQYIEKYQKQLAALEPKKEDSSNDNIGFERIMEKTLVSPKGNEVHLSVTYYPENKNLKYRIYLAGNPEKAYTTKAEMEKDYNKLLESYNKKNYTIKTKKAVVKKAAAKKAVAKKSTKAVEPTGDRTERAITQDKQRLAKKAGKRISENGNIYYENRENRSDKNRKTRLEDGGMAKGWKHRGK